MKNIFNPRPCRGFFRLKTIFYPLLLISSILIWTSCTTELDTIGQDLIDGQLNVDATDTLTIRSITQTEDSVPSSLAQRNLLGFYSDQVFGNTLAGIYTEAIPASPSFDIAGDLPPEEILIDSVVLSLATVDYFGDPDAKLNINVYELSDTIPEGTLYSNNVVEKFNNPINLQSDFDLPMDSIFLGNDTVNKTAPHLRIPLSEEFARKFIDDPETTQNLNSNDDFRGFFKGFYIEALSVSGMGAMAFLDATQALSNMIIYYKHDGDTVERSFTLPLNTPESRRYTHFSNFDYQNVAPEIQAQIENENAEIADSLLFIQSMANFRVKIEIPFINDFNLQQQEIAINSAKLIIPIDEEFLDDTLDIASALILLRGEEDQDEQENSEFLSLIDQSLGSDYFGGNLDEDKMEYTFNITQHFQRVIDGSIKNTPLFLRISGSVENTGRAVLKGPGRTKPSERMRVEIKYTKLIDN
ncbi:MAG: DUF4270 domain-containing protein [Bacteroidota bacterium]